MADPVQLTADQTTAIANAGAGPLADLARQAKAAGGGLQLDAEAAKNHGAGFVSDLLRMSYVPPEPPTVHFAACKNIAPDNPCTIIVSADDFPFFAVGAQVTFDNTGSALLDGLPFIVQSVNNVGKSFKVNCDRSTETPIQNTGTVSTPVVQTFTVSNMLTDLPPAPQKLAPQVPNGYEQAKEAGNAV